MPTEPTPAEISTNDIETLRRHYPNWQSASLWHYNCLSRSGTVSAVSSGDAIRKVVDAVTGGEGGWIPVPITPEDVHDYAEFDVSHIDGHRFWVFLYTHDLKS